MLLTILDSDQTGKGSKRPSLRDFKPSSVGTVLREYPDAEDDLLGEMMADG